MSFDVAGPEPGTHRPLFVLAFVLLPLVWASNAATVAFDQFGYGYADPLSFRQLFIEMLSVSPSDVGRSIFNPFFGFVHLAMVVSLAAIAAVELIWPARRAVAALVVAALATPLGALAADAMLESWSLGYDGEWLGEGWPIFEGFFVWNVALWVYAASVLLPKPGRRAGSAPVVAI